MQTIFVVEDDDSIREMVIYALRSANFEAKGFADGGDALTALAEFTPSLVLLDIMLPTVDGMTILKTIREEESTKDLPVIMLTAKGSEMDRIKGLDLGSDDYITKPFSIMEVLSRVKAVLRRSIPTTVPEQTVELGEISLNPSKRIVLVHGEEIPLTYKEFELLHYMMTNKGIALSRDILLNEVWGFDYSGESRTVDMHIKSLRKKLGPVGDEIRTVRNVGYKIGG